METTREGASSAAVKLLELLKRHIEGDISGEPLPRAGVTSCGRFAFRVDEQGRLWASPIRSRPDGT